MRLLILASASAPTGNLQCSNEVTAASLPFTEPDAHNPGSSYISTLRI